MAKLPVTLTDDFLQSLVTNPVTGLIELIDNALDADAKTIDVAIKRGTLGGPVSVTVSDDGTGMSHSLTERTSSRLGDSWKKQQPMGAFGRVRRGRRGRGRFAAFAIGSTVTWTTTSEKVDGKLEQVIITGVAAYKESFEVDGPTIVPGAVRGTVVTISDLDARAASRLDGQEVRTRLGRIYAPYLQRQRSLRIVIDGVELDPRQQQLSSRELPLTADGLPKDAPATVTVVEWRPNVDAKAPQLVLTDLAGDPVLDVSKELPPAPFRYSAYLAWDEFSADVFTLPFALNSGGSTGAVISAAIDAVGGWVLRRLNSARAELVRQWKEEQSYPYTGSPVNVIEEVERDLFDLVATTAAPALASGDTSSRKLSLALIREALRHDASEITEVLGHVLTLEARELASLRDLLERTDLSSIVATARLVASRVDVVDTLDKLTTLAKPVAGKLERPVHELAAGNAWLSATDGPSPSLNVDLRRCLNGTWRS